MASQKIVVKIEGKSEWRCLRAKGGNWVAVCEPLQLTIQSETWATLMEDIGFTLNDLFLDLLKSNELERFLSDRGWRPVGEIPAKSANVWFDLPFVTKRSSRDSNVAVH
jgi:hypothetical protein